MNEKPILMSTPNVQSILAWRKNETRRTSGLKEINEHPDWFWLSDEKYIDKKGRFCQNFFSAKGNKVVVCPYGGTSDILWVRETSCKLVSKHFITSNYVYKADIGDEGEEIRQHYIKQGYPYKWKPSIFMPREVCRIKLEIAGIHYERLADISEAGCIAEGIEVYKDGTYRDYSIREENNEGYNYFRTAIESYRSLWNSINNHPKPIQQKIDGRSKVIGYEVYPFDQESAEPYNGLTMWNNKPLKVITNPWVCTIRFRILTLK